MKTNDDFQLWIDNQFKELKQDPIFIREGILIEIANIVSKRMNELNLSEEDLALKIGVDKKFIHDVLTGESEYNITFLAKLIIALKIEIKIRGKKL